MKLFVIEGKPTGCDWYIAYMQQGQFRDVLEKSHLQLGYHSRVRRVKTAEEAMRLIDADTKVEGNLSEITEWVS